MNHKTERDVTDMLDILIKNASIVDGTKAPIYIGDVGIKDGKIVLDGLPDAAEQVIDATGLHLTPGFIDMHSHGDLPLGHDFAKLCKVSQGITTEIAGQCGASMFPVTPEHEEELKGVVSVGTVDYPKEFGDYTTFEKYTSYVDRTDLAANIKILVGHSSLRVAVMGYQNRKCTSEELEQMKTLLREAMEHGAMGMSSGLIYPPSCYADTEELIELAKVVGEYGGIYATHMRNESYDLIKSVKEALLVGKEAGVPVSISHHKACGIPNWNLSVESLRLIREAQEAGQKVTVDQYPYLASMTNINAVVPPKYFDEGVEGLGEKVKDPKIRESIKKDILNPDTDFENQYLNCGGWEHIMISSLPMTPEYDGMTFAEVAKKRGQDGFDAYFDILAANRGRGVCIYFSMCEEDLCRIFLFPDTVVGTDGLCRAMDEKGHPRAWGTFPHAICYFQKEKKLLSLEEMIYKITLLPAQRAMLEKKGAIKDGWDADLLLIDYDRLKDMSEYRESNVVTEGMEYVIVGGEIVYHDKKLTGANPGRLIRHKGKQ